MENINIEITILAPLDLVWECFTDRDHIEEWYFASEQWHCPNAENNFEVDGVFNYRMEAKDGSFGFNFTGKFDEIVPKKLIRFHLDDGRNVEVAFLEEDENTVQILQNFQPEKQSPRDMQREGWYAILNNFHKYVENYKENVEKENH